MSVVTGQREGRDTGGGRSLDIFVPRPGGELCARIWTGSGIVGSQIRGTGKLRIDFEGDRGRFPRFVDRVARAAERHSWEGEMQVGYPTRACAYVVHEEVVKVGEYVASEGRVEVTNVEALAAWLDVASLADEGLVEDATGRS